MKIPTIHIAETPTDAVAHSLIMALIDTDHDSEYEEEDDDGTQQADESEDDDRDSYKNADQDGMYYFI